MTVPLDWVMEAIKYPMHIKHRASLVAQMVKSLPAVRETWVRYWEDPLEKAMATHSRILAWRIPWTERSLACCSSWGHRELDTTERLHFLSRRMCPVYDNSFPC